MESNVLRHSVGDRIYDVLLEQLISGEIAPGEKLSVDGLGRTLNVSQTPIRKALTLLEADGLVVNSYLAGYSATPKMTKNEFVDLFEVRRILEPVAASLAAERATDEQLEEIRSLGNRMADPDCGEGTMAYSEFAKLDSQFHELIVAATQNGMMRRNYIAMHAHVHMFRLMFDRKVTDEAISEHEDIIEALMSRQAERAYVAMNEHLSRSQSRLIDAFN